MTKLKKNTALHFIGVASLVLASCGSKGSEAKSAPPTQDIQTTPNQEEEEKSVDVTSPEFEQKQKQIAEVGAAVLVSGQCGIASVKMSKIVGGQDYLHALAELKLDESSGSVCQTKLFSSTDSPRLQWIADLTQGHGTGSKIKIKRKRPEKFRPPSEEEANRLRAIQLLRKSIKGSPIMVPVVFDANPDLLVYLMAVSKDEKKVATGPHYRAVLSPDGRTIKATVQLSAPGEAKLYSPTGEKAAGIQVESVDTDLPNEGHVFTSGMAEVPLLVPARTGTWKVDGLKFTLLDQ